MIKPYKQWIELTVRGLVVVCAVAIALGVAGGSFAAERPNVLFILTEDQGQHLSFVGTPGVETPNLDRIAKSGIYFIQAFVSYPASSASKATIYTGHYGHTTGLVDNARDYFAPADQLKDTQTNDATYRQVRIADRYPTLIEILDKEGYHLAISGSLDVAPNDKFPYKEWFRDASKQRVAEMIDNAKKAQKPFFYMCNIQAPQRPFRNSDQQRIGVDPDDVELPGFLPDTSVVREDYAEYLDACEVADQRIGQVLEALDESGQKGNTLVVFMSDHGPAYHRGKMSLYQFGLNVPLAFSGPGVPEGEVTDAMFAGVDMMPTLLEMLNIECPQTAGQPLSNLVLGKPNAVRRQLVFAEIAHPGQHRDAGMQERSVFDGRWKLIFRNKTNSPRTIPQELKYWSLLLPDGQRVNWHNRVYDEIVKRKRQHPQEFRLLAEIDNKEFGTTLPRFELYDTFNDPFELKNLAYDRGHAADLNRLTDELRGWAARTGDRFLPLSEIR